MLASWISFRYTEKLNICCTKARVAKFIKAYHKAGYAGYQITKSLDNRNFVDHVLSNREVVKCNDGRSTHRKEITSLWNINAIPINLITQLVSARISFLEPKSLCLVFSHDIILPLKAGWYQTGLGSISIQYLKWQYYANWFIHLMLYQLNYQGNILQSSITQNSLGGIKCLKYEQKQWKDINEGRILLTNLKSYYKMGFIKIVTC